MTASRAAFLRAFAASAFFIVPALLAPTCNNNDVSIGQDKQPVACQSNADCPSNVPCQNGFCAIPCSTDSDCSSGEVCVNGLCTGQNQGCQPQPEVCDGLDNDCNDIVDEGALCPAGQACQNGQCVLPQGCLVDSDCPPNQACVNGQCAPLGCQPQPKCSPGAPMVADRDGAIDQLGAIHLGIELLLPCVLLIVGGEVRALQALRGKAPFVDQGKRLREDAHDAIALLPGLYLGPGAVEHAQRKDSIEWTGPAIASRAQELPVIFRQADPMA